jgi:hypothetical protein
MSFDAFNPPDPQLPASRLAVRRAHLLREIRREDERGARVPGWFMAQSRPRRIALVVALTLGLCAGIAVAAVKLLGEPAPRAIQSDLHAAARATFVPQSGLRSQTARVVAETRDATLYGVSDKRGNYCIELVGASRGLIWAMSCNVAQPSVPGGGMAGTEIATTYVVTDNGVEPPVVQFGRLPKGAVAARALLADGTTEPITIGLDRFYLYQPSDKEQPIARRDPMTIEWLNSAGQATWSWHLQPPQPLRFQGTPLRRISGHVLINGATRVMMGNNLGPSASKKNAFRPLGANGRFTWLSPPKVAFITVVDSHNQPLSLIESTVNEKDWRSLLAHARRRP